MKDRIYEVEKFTLRFFFFHIERSSREWERFILLKSCRELEYLLGFKSIKPSLKWARPINIAL